MQRSIRAMDPPDQFLILLLLFSALRPPSIEAFSFNLSRNSHFAGIIFPSHHSFNSATSAANFNCHSHRRLAADSSECSVAATASPVKLHLKHHRPPVSKTKESTLFDSTKKDSLRIQTLFRRATEKKNQKPLSSFSAAPKPLITSAPTTTSVGRLSATVESGVALGSGEYFIDVFIGTPARHFSLILDTGSDLNWLQCLPCHACFEQNGPIYDPSSSSSYRNLSCTDPRCGLVSRPDTSGTCLPEDDHPSCPYFYWYGDHSNTTGDLATEVFTVNVTDTIGDTTSHEVDGVIFGCGHWNRGLFHGAAGLLGLGRGPLSFASQLRSKYGQSFSYCFVDRNSDLSVSSKLILGEDPSLLDHPHLNFTSFSAGKENPADTFYYLHIKGVKIDGEILDIPKEIWDVSENGSGGTIIDSGTTLSYFADPAYRIIKKAVENKVTYPVFDEFPVLSPCYNVSGIKQVKMPKFSIHFSDGAVWELPMENYFIRFEPEAIMCLAILSTPRASLSILGNYQQQNFHIMYDNKNLRLGYAPMKCSEL